MTLAYAAKFDLVIQKTDVRASKIDGSALMTYGMVIQQISFTYGKALTGKNQHYSGRANPGCNGSWEVGCPSLRRL